MTGWYFVILGPGTCFGEIALLGTGHMNRRTASIKVMTGWYFVILGTGTCFGEIALLGTGHMNRRTASIKVWTAWYLESWALALA
jgi:CRP-like cAMP-binding protein